MIELDTVGKDGAYFVYLFSPETYANKLHAYAAHWICAVVFLLGPLSPYMSHILKSLSSLEEGLQI